MEAPDLLTDSFLDFGAYKMPSGHGFEINANPDSDEVLVAKRYLVTPDQRHILIEAIQWNEARHLFAGLTPARTNATQAAVGQASRLPIQRSRTASPQLSDVTSVPLPLQLVRYVPPRPGHKPISQPIQQAKSDRAREPAFCMDWSLVGGPTNTVLTSDTTFFVGSSLYLYGKTRIEGGVVVKHTNYVFNRLIIEGE